MTPCNWPWDAADDTVHSSSPSINHPKGMHVDLVCESICSWILLFFVMGLVLLVLGVSLASMRRVKRLKLNMNVTQNMQLHRTDSC